MENDTILVYQGCQAPEIFLIKFSDGVATLACESCPKSYLRLVEITIAQICHIYTWDENKRRKQKC